MAKIRMCPRCGMAYAGEICKNKHCPGYLPDGAYNQDKPESSVEPGSNAVSTRPTTSPLSTPTEKGI